MRAIQFAFLLLVGAAGNSQALTVEDFENYKPGYNIIQHPDLGSFLVPGNVAEYTFNTGLTLIQPIPNPGSRLGGFPDVQGVVLGDWSLHGPGPGGAPFCFEIDCVSSADVLPSGTGYLAYNGTKEHGSVNFRLPGPGKAVGAYVTAIGETTLYAFDASNNLLASASIAAVLSSDWRTNFLSVVADTDIDWFSVSGDFFVMDDVTFDAAARPPVPEPETYALFLGGLLIIAARKAGLCVPTLFKLVQRPPRLTW